MKKLIGILVALVLMMTMTAALAEGDIVLGQVEYPAHGNSAFAVITVALQDDVIVAAKIDEFQFMKDREDMPAVGVPNSNDKLGESFPEGQVLGSKRVNNDLYSLNMQRAGSTTQIAANFNAIEAFVKGKTVALLEAFVSSYTDEKKAEFVDAVSGATTADTLGYVRGIVEAAKAAQCVTGTYTFWNKTGETVLFINLIENGENGAASRLGFKDGFAPNEEQVLSFSVPADREDVTLTLQFVTESGKIGIFNTLKIEEAPITLLDVDSVSGATPISFTAPN